MKKMTLLLRLLLAVCIAQCALNSQAQPAQVQPLKSTDAAMAAKADPDVKPVDPMLSLPEELVQALALNAKQQALLDEAHMARRKMWSALRNGRQAEYLALSKELENEKFDPRAVIALRKKIRQAADKRLDEVQAGWLEFWDSLSAEQSKLLVAYIKEQHILQGQVSVVRAANAATVAAQAKAAAAKAIAAQSRAASSSAKSPIPSTQTPAQ